ncbi:MAG TPA: DNA-binding response regulator [Sutterella sp.]|nr:DNA-binding response regulator [Sutterella sp.]
MRILLVEDDFMVGESLADGLKGEGYAVDWVRDGRAATCAFDTTAFDLIVLDLGLPGKDGLEVLKNLRARKDDTPVLVSTARDTTEEKTRLLDAGADDYLVKPFDLDELFARVRALLRRSSGRSQPTIVRGPLEINPSTRAVTFAGAPVILSSRELMLLLALAERPGLILSRSQLEEKLYNFDASIESNTIEVHIHHLRKKLDENFIKTVRGVGYTLNY